MIVSCGWNSEWSSLTQKLADLFDPAKKILRLDTATTTPKEELEQKKVTKYICTDRILKVNFRDSRF